MSWQPRVAEVVCVPSPWLPPFHSPLAAPVLSSWKMRGLFTTARKLRVRERHLDDDDGIKGGLGVDVGVAA